MTRRIIGTGIAAALVAIAATTLPAHGQPAQTTRTLTFTGTAAAREMHVLDLTPKGLSAGDHFLIAETLRQNGATAGRMEFDCEILDHRYQGQTCHTTLLLKDGQVTTQGAGLDKPLAGVAPTSSAAGDESAITGGTRDYRGASGTVTVKSTPNGETVTIALDS